MADEINYRMSGSSFTSVARVETDGDGTVSGTDKHTGEPVSLRQDRGEWTEEE